jgi:pimeloyl-ACP methyl ester carboxylesterase
MDALRSGVIGLSMGGMIGQGIALVHPDRLLSLSSATPRTDTAGGSSVVQNASTRPQRVQAWSTVPCPLVHAGLLKTKPPEVERIRRQFWPRPWRRQVRGPSAGSTAWSSSPASSSPP